MSVQRLDYDEYETDNLVWSDDGPFVNYSDYAALEARCAGLERELACSVAESNMRASLMVVMSEQRDALQAKLAAAEEALRHTCKHLCQWKAACEVGCPVSAALAATTTDEVQP